MATRNNTTAVRQKQIVAAARKLIVKYGSEHVTIRRIAKEIKVSEGAIYRHFASKRDVLSLMVDDAETAMMVDVADGLNSGIDALSKLESVIKNIQRRRGVDFQVVAEIISFGDRTLNKKAHELIDRYIACISEILSEGITAGIIREDLELEPASIMFFGIIQGVVNLWTLSHYDFDLEKKYSQVWSIYRESIVGR